MQGDIPRPDRLRMGVPDLNRFLAEAFPHAGDAGMGRVTLATPGHVRTVIQSNARNLRPGGIVSGPTMMSLADVAAYALVLAHIGPVAMAVTNALTIHFLRPCPPGEVTADARLLRLGRRIITLTVQIWAESPDSPVAHATVAYTQP